MEFLVDGMGSIFTPDGDCTGGSTLNCTCNDSSYNTCTCNVGAYIPFCFNDICSPVCNFDWDKPCNPKSMPMIKKHSI